MTSEVIPQFTSHYFWLSQTPLGVTLTEDGYTARVGSRASQRVATVRQDRYLIVQ